MKGARSDFSLGRMKLACIGVATRSNMLNAGNPSMSSMVLTMLGWL